MSREVKMNWEAMALLLPPLLQTFPQRWRQKEVKLPKLPGERHGLHFGEENSQQCHSSPTVEILWKFKKRQKCGFVEKNFALSGTWTL